MNIGAVGYSTDFYRAGYRKNSSNDSASKFTTMGSATQETTSSNNGKTIGVTTAGNTGLLAKYADSSTPAEPIIKVGDYEVRVNDVDPNNATELEMFALMSYMEDVGMIEKHGIASYSKMKAYASQSEYDGVCSGIYDERAFWDKKQDWFAIIDNAKQTFSGMTETYSQSVECGKLLSYLEKWNTKVSSRDLFSEAVQKFRDDNQLSAQELKEEKDWREMTDEEWDKMLEGVDEYIDAFKERLRQLKEIQDEAAQKAALEADSGMRATAASAAALSAAANGFGGTSEADAESQTEDGVKHEKNWTKNLKTDDQTVLRTAKEAQEMENKALSRFEEVQLTGTTTVGVSQTDTGTECASVEEDENKEKVWTITAFGEDGIVSTRCQNGKIIDSWEIKYTNPNDAKKVQDFIGRFEKDANLIFSGSKDFWEEFLSSDMDADSIFAAHAEVFDKAAPDAPLIVKNAWMNAAKETGYLEGGKMNHMSQLLVRQVINRENGVGDYQNVFGNSVTFALQAAKEILQDLENPLTPISERGENAREYIEQEKAFYKKFIDNLEEITNILVGDENNMYIDKEKALKYASKLDPVDDIASIVKQPIKLAGRTQINRANNSIDIALGASIKVPGGFTLTVREKGVEVSGVTNWDNQKESQEASDMAGALATLLRNASGQMNHVGTDSSGIARWNENVEKVLSYFGIDASKDFTVNGIKYTKEGSRIVKSVA
jgi:hypothetical protein